MPLEAGFLSMLTTTATWEENTGHDAFGNETYASPSTEQCFIASQNTNFGLEDGHAKQDGYEVTEMSILFDSIGIGLGDRIVVAGKTLHVIAVETPKDQIGTDIFHTVTATTTKKG